METGGDIVNAETNDTGSPTGYPHLALCILDAVWKARVDAATVQKVLARYCAYAKLPLPGTIVAEGVSPEPLRRFLEAFEQWEPERFAADILQNRQRTASQNGILKAEAACRVARILSSRQIEFPAQVTSLQNDPAFEQEFHAIPGLGPAALGRLYALCGGAVVRGPWSVVGADAAVGGQKAKGVRKRKVTTESNVIAPESSPKPNATEAIVIPQPSERATDHGPPTTAPDRYTVRIREMPTDERPRERLQNSGAEALSHAELIAILLRTGTEQFNVIQVAERLLADNDGLRGVAQMTLQEMANIPGIGLAKATQIKAAIELGRRLVAESPDSRYRIRGPQDIYNLLGPRLRDEKREHFVALLLDAKGGVMRQETISIGDLSSSIVNPREVFRPAVRHAASSIVVAHNHPSGDTTPSPEDIAVTRQLVEAGKLLSIEVLDHIILGDNRYLSLKERNLI